MNIPSPHSKGFTIYTKTNCSFCTKVKTLLEAETPKPVIVLCDDFLTEDRDAFLAFIKKNAGVEYKTFPMVFYNRRFVGGFTETKKYIDGQDAFDDVL